MVAAKDDLDGEGVNAAPKPSKVRAAQTATTRDRNDAWLKIQRTLECSDARLAEVVNTPYSTVAQGLREARARDEAATHGLSDDDLRHLHDTYGPAAGASDDPDVRDYYDARCCTPEVRAFLAKLPNPPMPLSPRDAANRSTPAPR